MFKVIFIDEWSVLHSLFINDISTNGKLPKYKCTPLPKLSGAHGVDAIADWNDGIKTINKNFTRNIPITFFLNYPVFPDSCILIYFSLRIYIFQMFINCAYINIEQYRHRLLRQPQSFVLIKHFNAFFFILYLKNKKFSRTIAYLQFLASVITFFHIHLEHSFLLSETNVLRTYRTAKDNISYFISTFVCNLMSLEAAPIIIWEVP